MKLPSLQNHYVVTLETVNGGSRHIHVKASSSEIAGKRAMKRVPKAIGVRYIEKDTK